MADFDAACPSDSGVQTELSAKAANDITENSRVLLGGLTVEPKRNTRLIQIRYESPDPALAADVSNAVATAYVQYNLDLKLKGARDSLAWLTSEAASLKKKVDESQAALQNYRVKAGARHGVNEGEREPAEARA